MQAATSPAPLGNAPQTVKVKMPDGTFKVKVQQLDGSWRWQKPPKQARTTIKPMPTPAAGITAASPFQAPGIVKQPESKATTDNHETSILPVQVEEETSSQYWPCFQSRNSSRCSPARASQDRQ